MVVSCVITRVKPYRPKESPKDSVQERNYAAFEAYSSRKKTNPKKEPAKSIGPGDDGNISFWWGRLTKGAPQCPQLGFLVSSSIIFGNQTISGTPPRLTALRPYLTTGLPLSSQSLTKLKERGEGFR